MKGWVRLGLVVTGFWIGGTCIFAIVEFLLRDPATCRSASASLEATGFFFRCHKLADLVPGAIDRFLLEFRPDYFLIVAFAPVVFGWAIAVKLIKAVRSVVQAFKK